MSTDIAWTDETWNPTVGCSRVSPGCGGDDEGGCYAERLAHRGLTEEHRGLTVMTEHGPRWTGEVRQLPDRLDIPFRWRRPRRVFVDSMSDLFLADDEFMARVWAVMSLTPQHTYQVLTKRHRSLGTLDDEDGEFIYKVQLARRMFQGKHALADSELVWPVPNVWLGVSVENQRYADLRIPHLLATPAAVRFLSIEPLLGPVDLRRWLPDWDEDQGVHICQAHGMPECTQLAECAPIDWVIVGGESGPGARPMELEWAEEVVAQCQAAAVPVFVKQLGTVLGGKHHQDVDTFPESLRVREYPA